MPPKKIDTLRAFMAAGQWPDAIRLAASFPRLGAQKTAIERARMAYTNPGFARGLGMDPAALIAAGIDALQARY